MSSPDSSNLYDVDSIQPQRRVLLSASAMKDEGLSSEDSYPQTPEQTSQQRREEKRWRRKNRWRGPPLVSTLRFAFSPWPFNILLLTVPVGISLKYAHQGPVPVFIVNFIAIFPCTRIVILASEELIIRSGEFVGVLISVTFRNAAQLILSVFLLKSKQLDTLRTSLFGSLLVNNLLMLPLGFILGGWNRVEQFYNITAIQASMSLSLLSTGTLLIVTVAGQNHLESTDMLASQSRGVSVVMLLSYAAYLWFGLRSHYEMYTAPSFRVEKRRAKTKPNFRSALAASAVVGGLGTSGTQGGVEAGSSNYQEWEEDEKYPYLTRLATFVYMIFFTALLAFCTQFATDNLQGLVSHTAATQTFIGLILLPLLTVDPSTIQAAIEDKQDQNINSNLGANIQATLGVIPFMVLLAWMIGIEFTLVFNTLQTVEVAVSTMLVLYVTSSGTSNWASGVFLIALYIVIAVAAFFTP